MVCDGIISLRDLNPKHVRHSFTMSLFGVQNNFIKNCIFLVFFSWTSWVGLQPTAGLWAGGSAQLV